MPHTILLPTDNGDDEIEMPENDKGSIMILDMGQTLKIVRFFNTFNPIKEVADANVGQIEIVLGFINSELSKHIEMPECVKQNLLTLFKFGRNGLARQTGYQKAETRDIMLDSFACYHFAQFLCSDHTASLQSRFSFINEMKSHEKILGDKYCSIFPVEIQDGVYGINNRNAESIEQHSALKSGTRLLFYMPQFNSRPKSLHHSGVYLDEGYFIAKEGPANVVVTTIDNYMKKLSESYEHDQLIYAALPLVFEGSSFYGHLA